MDRAINPCSLYRRKSIRTTIIFLLLFTGSQAIAFSQDTPPQDQEITVSDVLKLPGTVIGEGQNLKAVGKFKVARYRVEHVMLPRTTTAEVGGKKVETGEAFRLTIVGGPFPVRAMPPVVWIDDVAVGFGAENEDLTEITVVTFDRAALREGANIYLSYGDKENKADRARLPEKLTLGGPKGGQQ
ncbi:MAG TPA: hypothetical protein VM934_14370 [Pyrinomonadaceae bacterium]|jgi:hypothetical protein|nr:hypothetical protein [Pyrinomonadaceae bacterium]